MLLFSALYLRLHEHELRDRYFISSSIILVVRTICTGLRQTVTYYLDVVYLRSCG